MKSKKVKFPPYEPPIKFPEVGGRKFPWYAIRLPYAEKHWTYDIYDGAGIHKGFTQPNGELITFTNLNRFKYDRTAPLANRSVRTFDTKTRKGLLECVRFAFLVTQETVEEKENKIREDVKTYLKNQRKN